MWISNLSSKLFCAFLLLLGLSSFGAFAQEITLTETEFSQLQTALNQAETQLQTAKKQLQTSNQELSEAKNELMALKNQIKMLKDQLTIASQAYEQLATFWKKRRIGTINLNLGAYTETYVNFNPQFGIYIELSYSLR
jgi:chromosome segregation ATPase